MRKMMIALVAMLTIAATGKAMSYEQARNEALFLTDKMAYELNLTDAQYEAAYEINLDYLMGVTSYDDVFGTYWERRNLDLSYILLDWQWKAFCAATYFFRPLYWSNGFWHFGVYARYPHRDHFFYGRPAFYATYRGGHAWHRVGGHGYYHDRRDHFRNTSVSRRSHYDRPTHHRPTPTTGTSSHHSNRPEAGSNTHHSNRPSNPNNRPDVNTNSNHTFDRSHSSGSFSSNGGLNSRHSSNSRSSGTFSSSGARNAGSISNAGSHSSSGSHSSGSFSRNSGGTFSSSHSGGTFSSHSSGSFSRGGGSSSHNSGAGRSSGGGHSYGGRR